MSNNQQIIDAPSERTIRTRTVKYSGYVIETTVEEYELNENTVLTRDVVEMPGAVAVAVLNDSNELLMLNQYRHPVRMNLWEVPAGLLDIDGEDPLVAAQRELAEEADLQADTWNALTDYFSSPGATSEAGRVYLARNLSELPAEEHSERTDEEAEMTYHWVPSPRQYSWYWAERFTTRSLSRRYSLPTRRRRTTLKACAPPRVAGSSTPTWGSAAKSRRTSATTKNGAWGGGSSPPTVGPHLKRTDRGDRVKQAKSTVSKTSRGAGLPGAPSSAGSSVLGSSALGSSALGSSALGSSALGSSALGASHQEAQTPLQRAIEQYLIHLRVERGSSEHTIASYARDLRRYSAYMATLGVIDPERITTAQVRSFMRELAAPTVPLAGFEAGRRTTRTRRNLGKRRRKPQNRWH